ncbi:MAG: YraN family protein [Ruminococcaceae bacterium]|nr:YraN family protein [Oscillospiraceae bacterium]
MENSNGNQRLGQLGESAACGYLLSIGHVILERNYRSPYGEIDIISLEGDRTVFTEVKTRSALPQNSRYGRASSAVTAGKKESFLMTARCYQKERPGSMRCRVDVIEVYIVGDEKPVIKHIRSAF